MTKIPMVASIVAAILVLSPLSPAVSANAAEPVVSGTVTADGVPVDHGTVGWLDPATGKEGEQAIAPDGTYSLAVPAGTPYVLFANLSRTGSWHAVDPEFVGVFYGAGNTRDYLYQSLTPYPAIVADTAIPMSLDRPATISGVAKAFAKKTVTLTTANGDYLTETVASSSGKFAFRRLIPGRYRVQATDLGPFQPWISNTVSAAAAQSIDVAPNVTRGGTLKGVVTSGGKPVAKVAVAAYTGTAYAEAVTDKRGRYTITGLEANRYEVSVGGITLYAPDWTDSIGARGTPGVVEKLVERSVKAGKTSTLNIRTTRGGAITGKVKLTGSDRYSVRIVDSRGRNVVGDKFGQTESNKFTFFGLSKGTYKVYIASKKRFAVRTVTVDSGDTESLGTVELTRKTIKLTGTVAGAKSGVVAVSSKGSTLYGRISKGRFEVNGLVPGHATVTVSGTKHAERDYRVSLTSSKPKLTKKFTAGAPMATVTASVYVGSSPLSSGEGFFESTAESTFFSVDNGRLRGTVNAGKNCTMAFDSFGETFVQGAPFWLEVPKAASSVRAKSGSSSNLGVIQLAIGR
jgi:hypothetical protein